MEQHEYDERQLLIQRLKCLMETNEIKQQKYQQQNGINYECGCITRESVIMASLLPKMQELGVGFDDCR